MLIAIVAAALIGGMGSRPEAQGGPASVVAAASAAATAASPVVTPVPTPSRRSDWPAAIGNRPIGSPGARSAVHLDRVNRFTIDDVVLTPSRPDTTPPWVWWSGKPADDSRDQLVR